MTLYIIEYTPDERWGLYRVYSTCILQMTLYRVRSCILHMTLYIMCSRWHSIEVGGWGRDPFSRNFMKPTPRRKWYLTTGRRFHWMVLDPIPQSPDETLYHVLQMTLYIMSQIMYTPPKLLVSSRVYIWSILYTWYRVHLEYLYGVYSHLEYRVWLYTWWDSTCHVFSTKATRLFLTK